MADWVLNVVFTGLITFVPVKAGKPCETNCQSPDSVEVLMVDARAGVNAGDQVPIASHMPALIYDPGALYLDPADRPPDLRFYVVDCVADKWAWVERHAIFLDGYRLVLPGTNPLTWKVSPYTISLSTASGQRGKVAIEPKCLDAVKGCPGVTAADLHVTQGMFFDDHKQGFGVTFFRRGVPNDTAVKDPATSLTYEVDASEQMNLDLKVASAGVIAGAPRIGSTKKAFKLAHQADKAVAVVANLPLPSILGLSQPRSHHQTQPQRDFEWLYKLLETEPARKPVPHPSPWDPAPSVPTYTVPAIGGSCTGLGETHPRCPFSQFP